MSESNFTVGDSVTYTTTGRFPKQVSGKVVGFENGWVLVDDGAGRVRKSRPSPLKRA